MAAGKLRRRGNHIGASGGHVDPGLGPPCCQRPSSLPSGLSPATKWAAGAPCRPVGGPQAPGRGCVPRGANFSPPPQPQPPLHAPSGPRDPHPRRHSASVGTRKRQQRLCARVTAPLSPLNERVAKAAHSNRAASRSAQRGPTLRLPGPPTPPRTHSGGLSRGAEERREERGLPALCPPGRPPGTQVWFGWRDRLRGGMRKTNRAPRPGLPPEGLPQPQLPAPPHLGGSRGHPPWFCQLSPKGALPSQVSSVLGDFSPSPNGGPGGTDSSVGHCLLQQPWPLPSPMLPLSPPGPTALSPDSFLLVAVPPLGPPHLP